MCVAGASSVHGPICVLVPIFQRRGRSSLLMIEMRGRDVCGRSRFRKPKLGVNCAFCECSGKFEFFRNSQKSAFDSNYYIH